LNQSKVIVIWPQTRSEEDVRQRAAKEAEMEPLPASAVALCGGAIGCAIGYSAKRGRLCTFGALEDAFVAANFRRLKVLAVALAIALLLIQAMIAAGALHFETIRYLPLRLPWLGITLGGLLFGFGMALVGTCAFGSLVRLGSGDMRSFLVILVYAVAALAVLRGGLAPIRLDVLESRSLALPGSIQADFAALASWLAGLDLRLAVAVTAAGSLLAWAFSTRDLFGTPRLLTSGLVMGLGVAAAWLVTGVLADDMVLTQKPEGLTFVAPIADLLQAVALPIGIWTFGIASVLGVVAGSFLASVRHDEFRWEAHDDQREMRRHIAGAAAMGIGGVLAGGCTIGQGLTAGSVLAMSWPLAVGGMAVGAQLGLYFLLECPSFRGALRAAGSWRRTDDGA
jgi:uncharacterized membrane protein YedE/YeeE